MHDESTQLQVIEPPGGGFSLGLQELWRYRDLARLFVYRDFIAQYKQTILGPAWHVVQPLMTTIVFTIVFGRIAQISTEGVPPFLFYMAGTTLWGYFAAVVDSTSRTFIANRGVFGKVYFPRLIVPISVLISRLIAFVIQFSLFLAILAYFIYSGSDIRPNWWVLATPILLLVMASLGLALGTFVTSLTTRYRDLAVLVGFGVQLMMYASPIVYPISTLPVEWQGIALLNPVAPLVEVFRHAYLGVGTINVWYLGLSVMTTSVLLVWSIILFNRIERTFMDTV